MSKSKHFLGDDEPPIKWHEPWEYGTWRAAVLKDESAKEELLQGLYAEQWDPIEAYKVLLHKQLFESQAPEKKSRHVLIDKESSDKRIAKAIWVECGKLLMRRMTPEARKHVSAIHEKMEQAAGITIYRGNVE